MRNKLFLILIYSILIKLNRKNTKYTSLLFIVSQLKKIKKKILKLAREKSSKLEQKCVSPNFSSKIMEKTMEPHLYRTGGDIFQAKIL